MPWGSGSFGVNLRWKNITFSTSFLYEFGGDFYNETLIDKVENAKIEEYNVDRRAMRALEEIRGCGHVQGY